MLYFHSLLKDGLLRYYTFFSKEKMKFNCVRFNQLMVGNIESSNDNSNATALRDRPTTVVLSQTKKHLITVTSSSL